MSDIYKRGNVYWFNKRIPADLQKHFGGRKQEQFSLKTKDRAIAQRMAQEIRDEWESLQSDPSKSEQKPKSNSDFLSSEELAVIETRFRAKIQSEVDRLEVLMGSKTKTLANIDNKFIKPIVRKLEALLTADDLTRPALESVHFEILIKTNLYQACLDASNRESLSLIECRRIARRVLAVLIDGFTQVQNMIADELYRPADLSKTQKHIRETKTKEAPQSASRGNKKLSAVFEELAKDRVKLGKKTIDLMRSAVNLLIEWYGERPISAYSHQDLVAFRNDCLLNLPSRRNGKKNWEKLSLKECCAKDKREDEKIAPKTVNNYLAYICSVFSYATKQDDSRRTLFRTDLR